MQKISKSINVSAISVVHINEKNYAHSSYSVISTFNHTCRDVFVK